MGLLPLDRETDAVFTGLSIATIVCIVSSLLYFMFKRAALAPSSDLPIHEPASAKRRIKKTNKSKRRSHLVASKATELGAEKNKLICEAIDEEEGEVYSDEANSEDTVSCAGSDQSSIDVNLEIERNNDLAAHAQGELDFEKAATESLRIGKFIMVTDEPDASINRDLPSEYPDTDQRALDALTHVEQTEEHLDFSQMPSKTGAKSKRAKRRVGKQQTANKSPEETANMMEERFESANTVVKADVINPPTIPPIEPYHACVATLNSTVKHLEDKLNLSEQKLDNASKVVIRLTAENEELFSKDEANKLGFYVLQQEYTQLLRTNKSIEHERMLRETKLKAMEKEKESLANHLEQINAKLLCSKTEADMELCSVRKELTEAQSKITSMAAALSAATAPQRQRGPSPDAVRTQELTQMANLSKDNRILKSRLEQFEAELNQLRQTNVIQLQEIQVFRVENRKLHEDKEVALEEMRTQFQNKNVETAARIANYEANIQCSLREVELEKQRQQDYLLQLKDVRTELKHSFDREKRQSDLIASLEHQFNELNAQKQRLLEEVSSVKVKSELSTGELHAQVTGLSNELQRTTMDLQNARSTINKLITELENLKQPSIPPTDAVVQAAVTEPTEMQVQTPAGWERSVDADQDLIKQLQEKLSDVESSWSHATAYLDEIKKENVTVHSELERYKTTLIETERLLANLQDSVEQTENKWSLQLSASESERGKLEAELVMNCAQITELSKRARKSETALKKMMKVFSMPQAERDITYSNRTDSAEDRSDGSCPKVGDYVQVHQSGPKHLPPQTVDGNEDSSQNLGDLVVLRDSDNRLLGCKQKTIPDGLYYATPHSTSGSQFLSQVKEFRTPQPLAVQDSDTDCDFDAVLVDDTDLHAPDDIWDSTANKFSESFSTEVDRGDTTDQYRRTLNSDDLMLIEEPPESVE